MKDNVAGGEPGMYALASAGIKNAAIPCRSHPTPTRSLGVVMARACGRQRQTNMQRSESQLRN